MSDHAKNHWQKIVFLCAGLLFLLIESRIAFALEAPKNPNSAKGCAICHYRWIDTFFVEMKGTDLVPYHSEKVAADPEMCFSCHDGSVVDSRERIRHGNAHKTGVKPPSEMNIPEIFPLDEDGSVQCATCHTAHGVESGPGAEDTIFLRTSNRNSAMCIMCHPGRDNGPDAGNHPIGVSKNKIPERIKTIGAHMGKKENQVICETCHTAHGAPDEGYLITGAGDSGLCLECHLDKDMFSSGGERNSNHVVNVKPQKAAIPESLIKNGSKLGYNGVITCQTCHKVHNNKIEQQLLVVEKDLKSSMCLACHTDKHTLEKTKHNLNLSAKLEKNLEGKTVAETGLCSACHLPHKAARKPYDKGQNMDRTTRLCLSCHSKGRVAENDKLKGYAHPVNIPLSGNTSESLKFEGKQLSLPLFNKYGVADKEGNMTCATCHDSHGMHSAQPVSAQKEAEVETISLLRKPSPEICRSCHTNKFSIAESGHDLNTMFLEGNTILTKKIQKPDLCGNCHNVHSSDRSRFVWGEKIMAENGSHAVMDLCSNCHNKNGLAPDKLIADHSHPVNIAISEKYRSLTLPLFDEFGKHSEKGIMTCYTCHDPHSRTFIQSKAGDYVDSEGKLKNSFLRIANSPSAGLCLNCHGDKSGMANTDHNLVQTAPESKNSAGRTPLESGMCGPCHLVHNNKNEKNLWARDFGAGENIMEKMCTSCHSENGAAAKKIPEISSHPDTLVMAEHRKDKNRWFDFPVFDGVSAAKIPVGNISCPSCHNVHHWSIDLSAKKMGAGSEGNVTNSFLRPGVHNQLCRECHGPDALFRYKYFHKASERKKIVPVTSSWGF